MGSIQPELSYGVQESVLAFCAENYEAGVPVEIDGLICLLDTKAKEYKIIKIHTTFTKPEVLDQSNKNSQMDEISQESSRILLEEFPSIITAGTGNNSNEGCTASNLDGMQFIHKEDENHIPSEREVYGSHAKVIQCKHAKKISDIRNMNDIAPMQKSYMCCSTTCRSKQIHNEENSNERITACGNHQQREEENHLSKSSSACRSVIGMTDDSVFNYYEVSGSERNTALRQNEGVRSGIFNKNQTGVSFLMSKNRNYTERNDEISCKQKEAIGERFDSLSSLTSNSPSPGQQEAIAVRERHTLGQPQSKNVVEKFHAIIKSEPIENVDFVESMNTEALSEAVEPSYGKVVQQSAAQNILEQVSPTIHSVSYRAWTHKLSDISVRNQGRSDADSVGSGIIIETNSLHVPSSSREDSCSQKSKQKVSRQSIPSPQDPSAYHQVKATETTAQHNNHSKFNQQTTADRKRESGTHRYCCTKCGTCFMHRTNLRRHIAASCSSKRIKAPCSICGKLLLNRSDSLKRHIETVHYKKSSSLISLARTFI
ncbi:hypothetical protein CHS0354_042109 [Potamilus streckersoni]|uniref:C2H2-type domain-containing protein n=1 Tax=Potamilus streckersoni TaxID=2493646 RepID=A0AAE0WFS5_9BIVA|nr:hypothetical protein CHS0354_042109 [Potamilus streckersoni]